MHMFTVTYMRTPSTSQGNHCYCIVGWKKKSAGNRFWKESGTGGSGIRYRSGKEESEAVKLLVGEHIISNLDSNRSQELT